MPAAAWRASPALTARRRWTPAVLPPALMVRAPSASSQMLSLETVPLGAHVLRFRPSKRFGNCHGLLEPFRVHSQGLGAGLALGPGPPGSKKAGIYSQALQGKPKAQR